MAEEDLPDQSALDKLTEKYSREGIDTRFIDQEFFEASELGDADSAQHLVRKLSPDERRHVLRKVDQQGRTALILAAAKTDLALVDVLIDAGANVNEADSSGDTALHYAAGRGGAAVVETLLQACADTGRRDDRGEEPLMWATGRATVASLVRGKADVNAVDAQGKSALMFIASRGDDAALEELAASKDVDLNAVTKAGMSAYDFAIAGGYTQTADLLVQLGAKAPESASKVVLRSATEALQDAARNGDAATCRELLRKDASLVNQEHRGETPLLTACSNAGRTNLAGFETLEVLLHARADPGLADSCLGETPLMRLVRNGGGDELLWFLLEAKADPSARDSNGKTAGDIAKSWKRSDAVEILQAATSGELPLDSMD